METRVFIVNGAGHDYTSAKAYGRLIYITRGNVSFESLDRVKFLVTTSVMESREDDWLLPAGRGILGIIAAIVWYRKHKKLKLLVHDTKHADPPRYRELIITESNLEQMFSLLSDGA